MKGDEIVSIVAIEAHCLCMGANAFHIQRVAVPSASTGTETGTGTPTALYHFCVRLLLCIFPHA